MAGINLVIQASIAKQLNLIHRQYFHLYGSVLFLYMLAMLSLMHTIDAIAIQIPYMCMTESFPMAVQDV